MLRRRVIRSPCLPGQLQAPTLPPGRVGAFRRAYATARPGRSLQTFIDAAPPPAVYKLGANYRTQR